MRNSASAWGEDGAEDIAAVIDDGKGDWHVGGCDGRVRSRRVLSEGAIASMVEIPFGVKELGKALRGIPEGNRRPPRPADVEPMRAAERARHLDALSAADPATAAHGYGLQPGPQCVSQIFDLKYRGLAPGWHLRTSWLEFAKAGVVRLIIRADVSSNTPVKLAVLDAQEQEIWATQPSTRITGTYTVNLKAPGIYELRIENPNSADANFTAVLNVTMCGDPALESWPWQYIKSAIMDVALDGVKTPMAPMGIASYGVMEIGGRYFTYELTTDAVKGVVYISPDVSALGYRPDGSYYGQAFSVQLNAFVVAKLKDRTVRYYSVQNLVGFRKSIWSKNRLDVWNNIWNATAAPSILDKSAVRGRGKVREGPASHGSSYIRIMPSSIPFGRVELETRAYVKKGEIIIEFYVNRRRYDEVAITPDPPADSAHIVIAPTTTPTSLPLDLELVFGGHGGAIPWAVLNAGRIGLELYVRMNGKWVPPPSAWSIGHVTEEASHARVEPQGVGSALIVPGAPNPRKLW